MDNFFEDILNNFVPKMSNNSGKDWTMETQMSYCIPIPQRRLTEDGDSFFQGNQAPTSEYSGSSPSPQEYNFTRAHSVSPNMMQGDCRRGRPQIPYNDTTSTETIKKREYARTYREKVSSLHDFNTRGS